MKKTLLITILFSIVFIASGCELNEEKQKIEDKAINACIKQGGVPILDSRGPYSSIKECQFPPNK